MNERKQIKEILILLYSAIAIVDLAGIILGISFGKNNLTEGVIILVAVMVLMSVYGGFLIWMLKNSPYEVKFANDSVIFISYKETLEVQRQSIYKTDETIYSYNLHMNQNKQKKVVRWLKLNQLNFGRKPIYDYSILNKENFPRAEIVVGNKFNSYKW